MPKILTDAEVSAYQKLGYHSSVEVMSTDQARDMRRKLEAFEKTQGGSVKGSMRFKVHLLFSWVADLIRQESVLDAVEDIIGPNILCWNSNWWIKEARSASFVSWHQDSNYWGLDTSKLVTVWVALSPATVDSGCMRVLPGSHLGESLAHRDTFHEDNMLTRGQEIASDIDESTTVNLEVATGGAAMFAYRIAHASHPNRSDDRRIGLALRFIPPETRQVVSDWDSATLVRGEDTSGHFEPEPVPTKDLDPVAVEFHEYAVEQERKMLYRDTEWKTHRT